MSLIEELLTREEGRRSTPYQDHRGFWTIGVGHLIDRRRGGKLPAWVRASFPLEEREIDELLRADIEEKQIGLTEEVGRWWRDLDEVRQATLLSMAFEMGARGVAGFRRAVAAIRVGDWPMAGREMRDSGWWRDPKTQGRAERHAKAMETGDRAALEV